MQNRHRLVVALLALVPVAAAWSQAGGAKAPASASPAPEPTSYTYTGIACPPIGVSRAPAKTKGAVRLAAFNVENLFDAKDDPALKGKDDDLPMATDETRLKNIAAAIKALDADVLALEEVESKECLTWFRDTYLKGLGYDHLASEEVGYYRGVEQSVLSRFPIKSVVTHADLKISDAASRIPADADARTKQGWAKPAKLEKDGFQRSPLVVTVSMPDGGDLTLMVVHFKAGGAAFAHQRELEALSVANLVDAERAKDQNVRVAVLGDFNATPMQQTAKVLRDKAVGGLISAYELRPEADRRKPSPEPAGEEEGAGGSKGKGGRAPASPEAKALSAKYYTHSFVPEDSKGKPVQRTIDYILLTPSLFERGVKDSYFVLSVPKSGKAGSDRPKGYASDHNPVAVDLLLGGAADGPSAAK